MRWPAKWIRFPESNSGKNIYFYVRKNFILKEPTSAKFHIHADSNYLLYINGKYLGRGSLPNRPEEPYYDTYPAIFKTGKNCVAILAYCRGVDTFSYVASGGGMICQIMAERGNFIVGTDSSWKFRRANAYQEHVARSTAQMGYIEVYNAEREILGWKNINFNHEEWQNSELFNPGRRKLIPRDVPLLKDEKIYPKKRVIVGEIIKEKVLDDPADSMASDRLSRPTTIDCQAVNSFIQKKKGKSFYLIYDFGREVSGYVFLQVAGEQGIIVDIGHGEYLREGRSCNVLIGNYRFADRYITGEGKRYYEGAFRRIAGRYLEFHFRNPGNLRIKTVGLISRTYPVNYLGNFECSDDLLNSIWKISRYTLRMCMHDTYEDCPWREQAQWLGDARVEALSSYYAFADYALMKKCIRQLAESQRKDGFLLCLYPGGYKRIIPYSSLVWIDALNEYYLYTGDKKFLQEMFPIAQRIIKAYSRFIKDSDLIGNIPESKNMWNFFDWAPMDIKGIQAPLNFYYCHALQVMTELCAILKKSGGVKYARMAQKIKEASPVFFNKKTGLFADSLYHKKPSKTFSRQTNSLAIYAKIPARIETEKILASLFQPADNLVSSGYYFLFFLFQAALEFKNNYAEEVVQTIKKNWSNMVRAGATTFWETPKGYHDFGEAGSLCHGWSAHPLYFFSAYILGIRPLTPGFEKILMEINPVGLKWAGGLVPTPHGVIKIEWESKGDSLAVKVVNKTGKKIFFRPFYLREKFNNVKINGKSLSLKQKGKYLPIA